MSLQLTPLGADRYDTWLDATRSRLIGLRTESGMFAGADAVAHVDTFLSELLPQGYATPTSRILSIEVDGRPVGTLWLAATPSMLFVVDLAFAETPGERAMTDLFAAVRGIAEEQAAETISMGVYAQDADSREFVEGRGFVCASIQMLLESLPDRETSDREASARVIVEPMTAERFPSFAAASEAAFAEELAASGRYSLDEARAESHRQMTLELPEGVASPGQELFTATVDGVEVGVLWIGIRRRDGRPHAFILDVEVWPEHQRRGYGRDLMHAAERAARRRGADSIGLHVFGANEGAIALYESLGYRRVEERFLLAL